MSDKQRCDRKPVTNESSLGNRGQCGEQSREQMLLEFTDQRRSI